GPAPCAPRHRDGRKYRKRRILREDGRYRKAASSRWFSARALDQPVELAARLAVVAAAAIVFADDAFVHVVIVAHLALGLLFERRNFAQIIGCELGQNDGAALGIRPRDRLGEPRRIFVFGNGDGDEEEAQRDDEGAAERTEEQPEHVVEHADLAAFL